LFKYIPRKKLNKIIDNYFDKIIQLSWKGHGYADVLVRPPLEIFIKRCLFKTAKILRFNQLSRLYNLLYPHNISISIMPGCFDSASGEFISDILDAIGREPDKVTVLDQPFEGCNPVKSFKFFDNPKAIIVDRDPRDLYLFVKKFLRPRGREGYQIPCANADEFIKYTRLMHQTPPDLHSNNDLLFINFESLIYDYENTIKKISNFTGLTDHAHKGKYFKPAHSRNNTQLFKKYGGFEDDIKKIESELSEYLFPFDKYPDITPEGGMFWGSQNKKEK
jgi:hypothetical protein